MLARLEKDIQRELAEIDQTAKADSEIAALVPFASTIIALEESRRKLQPVDSSKTAGSLTALARQIGDMPSVAAKATQFDQLQLQRAAETTLSLREAFKNWFNYHNGYDPQFTWWMAEPTKRWTNSLIGTRHRSGKRPSTAQSATSIVYTRDGSFDDAWRTNDRRRPQPYGAGRSSHAAKCKV